MQTESTLMAGARPKTRVAGEAVLSNCSESQQQEAAQKQDAQQQDAQQQAAQREFLEATAKLTEQLGGMPFAKSDEIEYIYNALIYAIKIHKDFVNKYFRRQKILFVGRNPRPNGMAQNGVLFGDGDIVRESMGLQGDLVGPYPREHSKHEILGLDCKEKEESGSKFWKHMIEVFGTMENFFLHAYVHMYCPLLFLNKNGKNVALNKLDGDDRKKLEEHCDECLLSCIKIMKPEVVVAIGVDPERMVKRMLKKAVLAKKIDADFANKIKVVRIFHPSKGARKAESTLVLREILQQLDIDGAVLDRQKPAAQHHPVDGLDRKVKLELEAGDEIDVPPKVGYRNVRAELKLNELTSTHSACFTLCQRAGCTTCQYSRRSSSFTSSETGITYKLQENIDCDTKNVIYLITCRKCGKQYCGETGRKLNDRFKEHEGSIRHNLRKSVSNHFNQPDHELPDQPDHKSPNQPDPDLSNISIIAIEKLDGSDRCRKDRESYWIKELATRKPMGMNVKQ